MDTNPSEYPSTREKTPMLPTTLIDTWVRPEIRALSGYHVPDASGLIKLDAMENPYRWPDDLLDPWLAQLRQVPINRYPDPSPRSLKEQLRETMGIPPEMEILLGNGSDELIQLIAATLHGPARCLLAPEPTFVMYRVIALVLGLEFVGVPLKDDFALDRPAMLEAMERHRPAVIFLSYPNNPTGGLFDPDDMSAILKAAPGLVVIDEAYASFAQTSRMDWLREHPNLIILRTLSKLGFAGLRLGFAVGHPAWMREMDKLRLPYNINALTQASVTFALRNIDIFEGQVARILRDREILFARLSAMDGITAWPSHANFILFRSETKAAHGIHAGLRDAGILIKNLHGGHPLLRNCLRVTVGKPQENQAFLDALQTLLS
uniref:Histidinol-phosphate aminotransferase n=1 Tax=Candidatus Kentrum sp. SD TaxID=2126332 RepID=A0A450YCS9_9GAMM|nr:MAG: histidinol phosphate aminotransferase apoenzyme [Candidatus Kentron sp. SD]VFK46638.1 MAG: histidinol phosphate aminotransferase apoenzyme [Candidatus Kentron sp. SD]VFK80086.1 MAG: histidinol phosphate aminotransferase apoenzyme [Candidatus Kentron sp. SD]